MSAIQPSVEVHNVSKTYRLYPKPWNRLKERFPWVNKPLHRAIHALQGVSFSLMPGECLGVVGTNGAGKSTLLKVLSSTTPPDTGRYTTRGTVAALLELGAGFSNEFSGKENFFMNAAILGFTRQEANKIYPKIAEFSELGDFLNALIKTYSSGMRARLAFSVAVAVDPDILILDEVLSVGDINFQRKCMDRIFDYKKRGKTIIFCSHSLYSVRQLCERALWLRKGKVHAIGNVTEITNDYATYDSRPDNTDDGVLKDDRPDVATQAGEQPAILSADLIDPETGLYKQVFEPGDAVGVRVHVRNGKVAEKLTLMVGFQRTDDTFCFAPHTGHDQVEIDFQEGVVTLILPQLRLLSGEFAVPVWLSDANASLPIHASQARRNLIVRGRDQNLGLFFHERKWQVDPLVTRAGEKVENVSKLASGIHRQPKAAGAAGGQPPESPAGGG